LQAFTGYVTSWLPGGAFVCSLFMSFAIFEAWHDAQRVHAKKLTEAFKEIDSLDKLKDFLESNGEAHSIPEWVTFQEVLCATYPAPMLCILLHTAVFAVMSPNR